MPCRRVDALMSRKPFQLSATDPPSPSPAHLDPPKCSGGQYATNGVRIDNVHLDARIGNPAAAGGACAIHPTDDAQHDLASHDRGERLGRLTK